MSRVINRKWVRPHNGLTLAEVAERLQSTPRKVRNLILRGPLVGFWSPAGELLVRPADLRRLSR